MYKYRIDTGDKDEELLKKINIFFIFSFGRSGSQFLTRILSNDYNAKVYHEPIRRDILEYIGSFKENYNSSNYIKKYRQYFIKAKINKDKECRIYGEVNSYLRRHADVVLQVLPFAKGLFVIRDGRDVVRSMISRNVFGNNWHYNSITPRKNDPFYNSWEKRTQFEKCCWLWASENQFLYNLFGNGIKLEKIVSDYNYFKSKIIEPTKISISRSIWEKERKIKSINTTVHHKIETYDRWPNEWKKVFWNICGEIMELNGYG